ncbi:MAG: hypothetical protein QXI16_00250 [Sulfolobaceae archaeon]
MPSTWCKRLNIFPEHVYKAREGETVVMTLEKFRLLCKLFKIPTERLEIYDVEDTNLQELL